MEVQIIGRGTWLDMVAHRIIQREKQLGRKPAVYRTESGLGASGIPHVGSIGDVARAYGIKLALQEQGCESEYIAFSDDLDGLRKVPAGLPDELRKYLGQPVTSIPDTFGDGHNSFGEHITMLLKEAIDRTGIQYSWYSATEAYRSGLLLHQIRKLLNSAQRVGEIIREQVGQEKYVETLPYLPICEKCGRIYTTRAFEFDQKTDKVTYACEGEREVRGERLEGCGYRGEVDIKEGKGKLPWKSEFAARWDALKINFEAYGKDITDSVRVNDRICEEILGYAPPYHVQYELFLDKGGRKISKSVGNVFTPQTWLRYGSPQSLLLLMYKRITGTRELGVGDVPQYVDELDQLEAIYFGEKSLDDPKELAKLRGLFEYSWLLSHPKAPRLKAPYNLLVYLVKVAPEESREEYIASKLKEYGYMKAEIDDAFRERIELVKNWAEDFERIEEVRVELSEKERGAISELVEIIRTEKDQTNLQNAIFTTAKKHGIPAPDLFRKIYLILLGSPRGPRLGPYIVAMGNENVAAALTRALS